MGGLVARAMVTLPNYPPQAFTHIVTLSTPHTAPPANVEHTLETYGRGEGVGFQQAVERDWGRVGGCGMTSLQRASRLGSGRRVPAAECDARG